MVWSHLVEQCAVDGVDEKHVAALIAQKQPPAQYEAWAEETVSLFLITYGGRGNGVCTISWGHVPVARRVESAACDAGDGGRDAAEHAEETAGCGLPHLHTQITGDVVSFKGLENRARRFQKVSIYHGRRTCRSAPTEMMKRMDV